MTLTENEKLVQIDGWEHVDASLEHGKGVILVATHVDNVEKIILKNCYLKIKL